MIITVAGARPIPVSAAHFRSEDFIKQFTGSYGILSPVEPRVTRQENEILAEVAEQFAEGKFSSAESKLIDFINLKKNPVDGSEPSEVSPALIFVLGNLYFQNDRPQDAERAYKLAIKRFPKFRRAFKNLAMLYAMDDKYNQALPYLKEAIQLGDSSHSSFGLLGYCYLSNEKALAAEGAYRQAYLLNSDERDWKLGLAQALLMQEKWDESAALLTELINENPDNPQLWLQQANCFLGKEDTKRAAYNFEVLRFKGIADAKTLTLLGNIYMDQEQPELALNAYVASLEAQKTPDVDDAIKTANILVEFEAVEQAKAYLAKVEKLKMSVDQQVEKLLVEKGVALAESDSKKVEEILLNAYGLQQGNSKVQVQLADFYLTTSKEAESLEEKSNKLKNASMYYKLAKSDEAYTSKAYLGLGRVEVAREKYIDAVPYLTKAVEADQSNDSLKQYVRRVERFADRQKKAEELNKSQS